MGNGDGSELNALAERYYTESGTRKPISYLAEYERILANRRDDRLRILELGVSSGASLLIWNDYLPNATIVGIDIGDMPTSLEGRERIRFLRASQDDVGALDSVGRAHGPFDLIVDDASHIGYLTKRSFYHLFPRWLKPGGHYVIEDFGTGYMSEYPDGHVLVDPSDSATPDTIIFESHQYGMAGVVKQLVDHMMRELMLGTASFLHIERLTILTNIAFVQKSLTAPASPYVPHWSAAPKSSAPAPAIPDYTEQLAALTAELHSQDARLRDAEAKLERIRRAVEPFLRIKRMIW